MGKAALLVVLCLFSCAYQQDHSSRLATPPEGIVPPPAPLTAAEQEAAAIVAFNDIVERRIRGEGPIFFVHAEPYADKTDTSGQRRLALVTHYRYQGDTAITSIVDISASRVLDVRETANIPVPLARAEFEQARELALADPAVQAALGTNRGNVVVEPLLLHTASREDPLYAHRVVRLLFRMGRDYLESPIVHVDLTTRRVLIGQPRS
jgi:hypothetical protein